MSDYEDIKTIQYIVNTSPNKEIALQRFYATVGFSISFEEAHRELRHALNQRFEEQPVVQKELERVASFVEPRPYKKR